MNTKKARDLVYRRSNGACEGCDHERATDWAHRVNASQGGPWDPANGLHLGRRCHHWAHMNPNAARDLGWSVRRGHDFRTTPVLLARHGWVLLTSDGEITPTEKRAA